MTKNLTFEINPNHELITKLNAMRKANPKMAGVLIKQLLDNAMINAGMLSDTKSYVDRVNRIMIFAIENGLANKPDALPEELSYRELEQKEGEEAVFGKDNEQELQAEVEKETAEQEQVAEKRRDN